MADVYLYHYEYGVKADEETLQNVEKYADKVLELQPESADSYYLLGRIERFRGSTTNAIKYFKKAHEINPDHTDSLLFLGNAYGIHVGKISLAEQMFKRLFEIDPLSPLNIGVQGIVQMVSGQLDLALSTFQIFAQIIPDDMFGRLFSVYVFAWQKQNDKVFELIDQIAEQKIQSRIYDIVKEWCLFFKYALLGEKAKALETITEDVKSYFWNDPESRWFGVCNYALIDEKEEALNWLEHMIDRGFINYPFLNERAPFFENIRGEERFKKLMQRVKHEWENFEV